MTLPEAKRTFAELMQEARKRELSPSEKELLSRARQMLRGAAKSVMRNRKKATKGNPRSKYRHVKIRSSKGLHHFRTVKVGKHRVIIGCPSAHLKGGKCPVATIATSILHPPKENPKKKLLRMGKLVELRYHRDHGKSRGYYRHEFKSKPTLYFDRQRNQILAG